jgi:uncharacterized protein
MPYHRRMDAPTVIAATQHWLEKAVIGLNLCPFAKAEHVHGRIRYVVSEATKRKALRQDLQRELLALQAADPAQVETTLLIHPRVLQDFLAYNDFLAEADDLIAELGLEGELQIASFHPLYEFEGSEPGAIENYSNRSPYPMLHILREASVERAVQSFPEAEQIYARNIQTLRALGHEGWLRLMAQAPKI